VDYDQGASLDEFMSAQKGSKLNQLERALPEGLLVDASWLLSFPT